MDFHILGSLEVVDAHRVVTIGGNKQQALLAVLLLHPNETLSADRLIEELWGQHPPATAAKTLQVHVSRLRKTLADGNGADGVLGRTLATGSTDGTIRLWDMKTQEPVGAPLPGHPGEEVIPIWTPDGRGLIAAYDSGRAFMWDIREQSQIRQACRVAGRKLTRAEWEEFLPGRDYNPAC